MNAETKIDELDTITLAKGAHSNPEEGMCLLEAASFVAGEAFSDTPQCVSPVLGSFGRSLNDALPTDKRQELVPLIPRIIGTRGDGKDERRSYIALDWLIRTHLPTFLDLALPDEAAKVRALQPITDMATAEAAGPVVRAAGAAARVAARDAARVAAGVAAWDAARVAAGDAARVAAGDAARVAAGDAARVAAR
ncbi:hypothetical protein, partial [Microbacterium sp. NPDC055665]